MNASYKRNSYTLSNLLLELSGINERLVIRNDQSQLKNVTPRGVQHLYMLDENEIIKDTSPSTDGKYVNITYGKNAFKMFLTNGFFYNKEEAIKSKKELKRSKEKLTDYNNRIEINREKSKDVQEELENISMAPLFEEGSEHIKDKIHKQIAGANDIQKKINEKNEQIEKLSKEIFSSKQLEERFDLLKEQYEADEQRLKFILDGEYYLSNLETVACPMCERPIEEHEYQKVCNVNLDHDEFIKAIKSELKRVYRHRSDLESTIESLKTQLTKSKEELVELEKSVSNFEQQLNIDFIPKLEDSKSMLNEFTKVKSLEREKKKYDDYISTYQKELENLKKTIGEFESEILKFDEELFEENLKTFLDKFTQRLINWEIFSEPEIGFDYDNYDVLINGSKRSDFGKGYRAILNTNFLLTLLEHCTEKNLPYFGFNVFDTAIGNYREEITKNKKEEVKVDLILTEIDSTFKDKQVIIFDNKLPNAELEGFKITLFTSSSDYGREGFF